VCKLSFEQQARSPLREPEVRKKGQFKLQTAFFVAVIRRSKYASVFCDQFGGVELRCRNAPRRTRRQCKEVVDDWASGSLRAIGPMPWSRQCPAPSTGPLRRGCPGACFTGRTDPLHPSLFLAFWVGLLEQIGVSSPPAHQDGGTPGRAGGRISRTKEIQAGIYETPHDT